VALQSLKLRHCIAEVLPSLRELEAVHIKGFWKSERGFTIVEATVSMFILGIFVAFVAGSIISSLAAAQRVRWYQQATALGNEAVEGVRDLAFDDIVMTLGDPTIATNPDITTAGPDLIFDPDGAGPLAPEVVVATAAGGSINPHQLPPRMVDDQVYTIRRYVTWVDDTVQGGPGEDYKRVTAEIIWEDRDTDRVYTTSTFITEARRGLPTPKFQVAPDIQELTVEPGFEAVFSYGVENLGIVDTYDVDWTLPAGRTWTIIPYLETSVPANTTYDAGDTILFDTNSNVLRDTNSVGTGDEVLIHFVWTLDPLEALGTSVVPFVISSGADATSNKTVSAVINVGGASRSLYLHDDPFPPIGDEDIEDQYLMTEDMPTATTLYNYSTDLDTEPGRQIKPGGSPVATDRKKAQWVFQAPEALVLDGDLRFETFVANDAANCGQPVALEAVIRQKNSAAAGGGTVLASAAGIVVLDCNFQLVSTTLAVSHTVPKNKWIEVTLYVDQSITNLPVRVAYDTVAYPSALVIPTVVSP